MAFIQNTLIQKLYTIQMDHSSTTRRKQIWMLIM